MSSGPKVDYITNLTALRGFAAIFVLLLHAKDAVIYGLQFNVPLDIQLIAKGHLAVDLFFVLSGFVLMHVYGPKITHVDKNGYWSFIKNRFARVYPVHLTVMLAFGTFRLADMYHWVPQMPLFHGDITMTARSFITSLLMIQSWHIHDNWTWNVPAWSISSEWFVYLLAPFLLCGLRQFQKPWQALALILTGTTALYSLHTLFPDSFLTYDFGNLRMLFEFILGIGMYHLYAWLKTARGAEKTKTRYDWLFVGITIASLVSIQFSTLGNYYLINILVWLIPLAALSRSFIATWLSYKPLFYLGEISYSLYLVHLLVISLLCLPFRPLLANGSLPVYLLYLTVCTAASIAVAHVIYQYIEIPARDWLRQNTFFSSRSQPKTVAKA